MKFAIVTNIPAPYRIPIYNRLNSAFHDKFFVIYCAKSEPNREWDLSHMNFNHIFLKKNMIEKKDGFNYVHNNPDIWSYLKEINPDVIITTGFNPTHLYAWLFSRVYRKKHVSMTDGWIESEKHLSIIHRLVRKIVFKTSSGFIGASKNSLNLFESYGVKKEKLFKSHLCVDNKKFKNNKNFKDRDFDLMFSGQFTERKLPLLFAEIAKNVSKKIPTIKVLILGNGPLRDVFLNKLDIYGIDYYYPGFITQEELPKFYGSAKLFLFTTRLDPWGVVANEAMASGTPVITTPYAGIINDLLVEGKSGFILEPNSIIWAEKIIEILNNSVKWDLLSKFSRDIVRNFNFDSAAKGIKDACEFAYKN